METGSAILHEEPKPAGAVTKGIPPNLEMVLSRCLRKDPARRFQNIGDVKIELEEVKEESDSQSLVDASTAVRKNRRRWLWAVTIGIVLLAAGIWLWRIRLGSELPPPKVVTLTSYVGDESQPTFSPDGNKVAFEWYRAEIDRVDIYAKAVGETYALPLTSDPAGSYSPAWSPDDRHIAFSRVDPPEKRGIYLVSPLGGPERKISDFPSDNQISWTPDGKFLAAARSRPPEFTGEDPSGIYLVPVEGGPERRITSPKAPITDIRPSVSPDGKLLAFGRYTFRYNGDIYCQPLGQDGSTQGEARRITRQNCAIGGISWSRDGESVIYDASKLWGMKHYLWRAWLNADNPPLRLELAGPYTYSPAVAPSKSRLAFSTGRIGTRNIWSLRPNGVPEPFVASSLVDQWPHFSPDGNKIAFSSDRAGDTYDIWLCDPDGSNPVQLTHEDGAAGAPHWSPDGRLIMFDLFLSDGSHALYTVNPAGGRPRRLTPEPAEATMGYWSRDGRWIYFTSNRSGRREIWQMPATGGEARQITQHGADMGIVSVDGKTIYFTKETPPGLFAIPSEGGEEKKVADSVIFRSLAAGRDGIYFTRRRQRDQRNELCLLDIATLKSRILSVLEGSIDQGLTVSPDGKTILYSRHKESNFDLMLVENFR